jgi:DNA repair exonuclease SbcCD ATPase subunit
MSLKYIYHLSDLHIRNGDKMYCRYEEYKTVFSNTVVSIKKNIEINKLNYEEYIIIITGDIFHNKNNIGNFGLLLYKNFIQDLLLFSRLLILPGNHDFVQSDIEQPSLVYSSSFNLPNLTILNRTQSFIIDDIGFSYVGVEETLNSFKNSGRFQDLPPFPSFDSFVKCKIALFHGSFASAKLFNGDEMKSEYNPYPLEWVQDFDFVLLGDIHKRQIFSYKNKTLCGYAGSLIQQNFGEDIINHGYLIWNLNDKKVSEVNVPNPYGFINIKENENNELVIRKNGSYDSLLINEISNNLDYFPTNVEIKTFSTINFHNLQSLLKSHNINFSILSNINERSLTLTNDIDTNTHLYNKEDVDNIVDNHFILSFFNKLLSNEKYNKLVTLINNKESLLFDVNNYPDDLTSECIKRNKDLESIISSCIKSNDFKHSKEPFTIKYLEWEGLLCYEFKNWINMHDLSSKTFMVKGKNGTGKSAIYHILLLAIWGKIGKDTTLTSSIINTNKTKGYTIVDIEIEGTVYRIQRDFIKDEVKLSLDKSHIYLYKYVNDNSLELQVKDSVCNSKIEQLFGDINSFLSSSMITQTVDNDILNLKKDELLKLIDKSSNIEYIYNLYNLFKTAMVKYKDFRKVVESKKQVYEKLVANCKIEIIDDNEIEKLNNDLTLKTSERDKLKSSFDNINIDIKNPKNLIILETDYITLIDSLDKSKIKNDKNEIEELRQKYIELKLKLKDESDLLILKNGYNSTIENYFTNTKPVIKPCELSVLESEKKLLVQYFDKYNSNDTNDINKMEKLLVSFTNDYLLLKEKEKTLIENKPVKITNCCINKDQIVNQITVLFSSINIFREFISTLNMSNIDNKVENSLNFPEYESLLKQKKEIENIITSNKNKLIFLENEFNLIFKKKQGVSLQNKPLVGLKDTKLKTSASINKAIKLIDINNIVKQLETDDKTIDTYNKTFLQLENYKNELSLLTTNDEYKYNPKCEYCCKRPWVCRITELQIIIDKISNDSITTEQLNDLLETVERNKAIKANYELLNEWYNYYKSKEQNDKITKELNKIITDKNDLNKLIQINGDELLKINVLIDNFNKYSYRLYNDLTIVEQFEIYKTWENDYNEVVRKSTDLQTKIKVLEEEISYIKNIKPRIHKYFELKDLYNTWFEYDYNSKIKDAYELFKLKDILDVTEKYEEYITNNNNKPIIREKLDLNDKIKNKETEIKILNDKLIKLTTINGYNNENKDNYNKLFEIILDLDNTIDVLETIVVNFQAFRIEMYDKYILNKLTEKTNKIIKSLCHKETKPFKLDYMITVSRDIININWLINNETISLNSNKDAKQIISIHQASGFQHFVISMALRMSLFMNKYEVQCNQLFIDEGFVNFDKYNLSIVPTFLKSLLSYFSSVIVVSHIDLIQDNIDEIVEIKYNKSTAVSTMEYNGYKKTIVKRNRK